MRTNLLALCVGVGLLSPLGGAQATIVNGGFETGDFSGWTVGLIDLLPADGIDGAFGVGLDGDVIPNVTSTTFGTANVNVRSGRFAAYAAVGAGREQALSLSQSVNLDAGSYTAGFFIGNDSDAGFGVIQALIDDLLAIFVDGVEVVINDGIAGNVVSPGADPEDLDRFAGDFVLASGGAHNIEYRISGSASALAGISVDDFFVVGQGLPDPVPAPGVDVDVPEPGMTTLLGCALAGVGLARRRRRRR